MVLELWLLPPYSTLTGLANIVSELFAVTCNGFLSVFVYYGACPHIWGRWLFLLSSSLRDTNLSWVSSLPPWLLFCLRCWFLLSSSPNMEVLQGLWPGPLLFSVYPFPVLKCIMASSFQIVTSYLILSRQLWFCITDHLLDRSTWVSHDNLKLNMWEMLPRLLLSVSSFHVSKMVPPSTQLLKLEPRSHGHSCFSVITCICSISKSCPCLLKWFLNLPISLYTPITIQQVTILFSHDTSWIPASSLTPLYHFPGNRMFF